MTGCTAQDAAAALPGLRCVFGYKYAFSRLDASPPAQLQLKLPNISLTWPFDGPIENLDGTIPR
jgi:hypothetical protein